MPSQNINAGTVAPIINPESIPVDSDPEEDLEEIQCEAAQVKLAAAHEHIKRKQKAKEEEEAQKAEEVWKAEETRKAEEDKVVREKAQKRQLEVCSSFSVIFYES